MNIRRIGSRGILVNYEDLLYTDYACTSNIYIIDQPGEMLVLDTFLGPDIMAQTFAALERDVNEVTRVINTHSDWDHIWGNSCFKKAELITHENYPTLVVYPDSPEFADLEEFARGKIVIATPDITFDHTLHFNRLNLTAFYTPGHTADSISVYDEKDAVLIVGDTCEKPIPSFVNILLLEQHLKALEGYLELDFQYIIPGHGEIMTREDLMVNIEYLEALIAGDDKALEKYNEGDFKMNHLTNLMYMEGQE